MISQKSAWISCSIPSVLNLPIEDHV